MPFAAYLETISIPEWRKAYIDYKGLCAILELIQKKRLKSSTTLQEQHQQRQQNDELLYQSPSFHVESPHTCHSTHSSHASHTLSDTLEQEQHQSSNNDQLDLAAFYNVVSHATKEERLFFFKLDEQLNLISRFYNERENEVKSKMTALKIQMDLVRDYGHLLAEEQQEEDNQYIQEEQEEQNSEHKHSFSCWINKLAPVSWLKRRRHSKFTNNATLKQSISSSSHFAKLPIPLQYAKDDNLSYQVARGRLKRALTEFYRKLEYLQSYKEINMVGFHSILKKFERVAGWQAKKQYVEKVKQYHWASSQDLEKIMEDTVCLFANEFTCGNRVRSARCLKTMRTQKTFTATSWRVGFYFGAALILLLYDIKLVMDLDIVHRVSYIHTHLQIYACFSVPIIFTLGVSINMMVWTQCKVNYKNIFELNPRDNLDYHQFAELPCFMLLLLTLFMLFDFSNSLDPWLPSNQCPMTLFITLLTILLCPFNILYRSARYWLCRSLGRIVFSYFFPIEFRDFFIADELNSLSYSFWTLGYFFCAHAWDWTDIENGYRCHVTHMWITPFLATLAPWWRFLQCIRRYQDSSERVHLINAVKYTSTIVATFATGLRRIHPSTSTDIIWILTSMINSSYTSIWDIKMDWGLLQTPSRNFLLRDDLVFYKWVYYVAAPLNVLLRFAWALNTAGLTLHSDILGYITALMEAYRRIQWNFFRLENEHFNNYADYRAINEIPLPFATTIPVEDEEIGKIYSNAIQLLSSDDEAEEERRGLLISESDIASRGRRRTEEEVIEEEHPETQDTGALRLRRPSLISERRYSLPVSARGTKIPRRLQHQQMQRQYTWAHEITSATPTKSGTFYGCRDFEGKREDKKQQDDTSSASAGQRLHEQEDEDLSE